MANNVRIHFIVEGVDEYITSLDDLKTALDSVAQSTSSVKTNTNSMKNSVSDTANDVVDKVDLIDGSIRVLSGSFQALAGAASLLDLGDNDFFNALEENVNGVIALGQGAVNLADGYKLMRKNLNLAKIAQQAFNKVSKANPYLLLASAIIAVAGAIYAYTLNTKDSTDEVEDNTEALKLQNEELKKQYDRELKLAQLRGEDSFEFKLEKARQTVKGLEEDERRISAAIDEAAANAIEVPIDILDPSKGTKIIDQTEDLQKQLTEIKRQQTEARAELTLLEEEAEARSIGKRAREAEEEAEREETARKARIKAKEEEEDQIYLQSLSAQEREEVLAMQAFDRRIELGFEEKEAEELLQKELAEIRQKYKDMADAEQDAKDKETLARLNEHHAKVAAAYEELEQAKINAVNAGFGILSTLAGDNEKLQNTLFVAQQAFEAAQLFINGKRDIAEARAANAKEVGILSTRAAAGDVFAAGLIPGTIAAGTATVNAIRLNTAVGLAGILAASISNFKGGGSPDVGVGGGGAAGGFGGITYNFGQQAGPTIEPGQNSAGQSGNNAPTQTYVLVKDVKDALDAQEQIENLSRL